MRIMRAYKWAKPMYFLGHVGLLVAGLAGFAVWPNIRGRRPIATSSDIQDVPCDFKQTRVSRSNQVTVTVAIACDERFEFTLRREKFTDRLAKALHVVREFQTQDERFDEAVYIGADERGIDEWLAHDAEARRKFLDLLAMQPQEYTRITAIAASRGALTLSAQAKPPMFTSVPNDLGLLVATAVIPDLKSALDRLQAFAASDVDPIAFRDPYVVGVRTLTWLTLGLLLVPFVLFFLLQLQAPQLELATNYFTNRYALAATAVVVCTLAAVGVPQLWGSARMHTVLAPLVLVGGLGTLIVAPALIHEINAEWDISTPQRYPAQVLNRYMTHGKNSTHYYLWLTDWHSQRDHQELRVDAAIYNELMEGDAVVVSERDGYLGERWLSDLSRALPDEQRSRR
jgi:hypothetical protein